MQVLLNIPNDCFKDECSPAFAYRERDKIDKQYNLRFQDSVEVVNIGPGADWLVIMATMTVAWNIFQLPGIVKDSLKDAYSFEITDISGMFPNREDSLAAHPHNYYVFTFYIAERILVLSVRSTGEIRELESFDDMPYGLIDKRA